MDEKVLLEAVENISLIKGVIARTSKSFVAFSKIFIYWGLLFLVNAVAVSILVASHGSRAAVYPILTYIFPIIRIAAALAIYVSIVRNIPLVGLEKHLMVLWMLILLLNMLPPQLKIFTSTPITDITSVSVQYSNLAPMLFSLAIALLVTSMFTGFRQPQYLGLAYIGFSIATYFFPTQLYSSPIHHFLLPVTFLYLGMYLKTHRPVEV